MSVDGYCSFLQRMGHNVRFSAGVYWYDVHPRVYMSFPYHRYVDPSEVDRRGILGNDGLMLRYPSAANIGALSYRITCSNRSYDIVHLSKKARNQTRRALENCVVEQVDFKELSREGIHIFRETLERQGRRCSDSLGAHWSRYCAALKYCDGAEAWATRLNGNIVAYLVAVQMEGCANILLVRSKTSALQYYPNNALVFRYVQQTLQCGQVEEVSLGLESVEQDLQSLDHFKVGMGFERLPIGQRVELSCLIRPFVRRSLVSALKSVNWAPGSRMKKFLGVCDLYFRQPLL